MSDTNALVSPVEDASAQADADDGSLQQWHAFKEGKPFHPQQYDDAAGHQQGFMSEPVYDGTENQGTGQHAQRQESDQ